MKEDSILFSLITFLFEFFEEKKIKTILNLNFSEHSFNELVGLISLFHVISSFMGYLMQKPSLKRKVNRTIKPIVGVDKGVHIFSQSVCLKVNVIWLEFELA